VSLTDAPPPKAPDPKDSHGRKGASQLPALLKKLGGAHRWRFDRLWTALRPLTLVLVAVIAAQLYAWTWLSSTAKELATHSASLDAVRQQNAQLAAELSRVNEALAAVQMRRDDLERLANDVHSGWSEITLIEAERLVSLAAGQLKLSGNVAAAIRALQLADARLARARHPTRAPWPGLRRNLERDIAALRALPQIDVTASALQIDDIALSVEHWPMLADVTQPLSEPHTAAVAISQAPSVQPAPERTSTEDFWDKLHRGLRQELDDWIRVRRVEGHESLLLDQTGQQLVRQQLRLRLLDARLALIAHNEELYQRELKQAHRLLTRYFDPNDPKVGAALASLDQFIHHAQAVAVPKYALDETLANLQSALIQARQQP